MKRFTKGFIEDDDDGNDNHITKRRVKRQKNVRSKHYKDKHILNMLLPFTPQYHYARLLAESMDDLKSLPRYLKWTEQFPKEILEEVRRQVLARKDVNNKGAYFTVVLKHHEYNHNRYSGD